MSRVGHISLSKLPSANLRRRPLRTGVLVSVVAVLSLTFFCGTLLLMNLNFGLKSMQDRLGADIMVVPQGTDRQAESALINQVPATFYFPNDIEHLVAGVPGVKRTTGQTYVASLAETCCDDVVQIIAFNPETDFVIQPWITSQFDGELRDGEVITGANVYASEAGNIKLFGHHFPVAAQLSDTGTSLDNSVFINRNTMRLVVNASAKLGKRTIDAEHVNTAVSSILVDVDPNYSVDEVKNNIRQLEELRDVGMITPGGVVTRIKSSLSGTTDYMGVMLGLLWVVGLIIMVAIFLSATNERKKEFASLRLIGATKRMLVGVVVKEAAIIGLVGGVIGIVFGGFIMTIFAPAIRNALKMPYLDTGVGPAMLIGLTCLVCAVGVSMIAATSTVVKMLTKQTYLTLRAGE